MAGQSGEDNPVGINVTALVDIIFCLCLFFMCSLKFKELDGKMDAWMPKATGFRDDHPISNTPVDEMRVLMSYDEQNGRLQRMYGPRPIENDAAGDQLLRTLIRDDARHFAGLGKEDVSLIIDAGEHVPWRDVVSVMNMGHAENIAKIEFGCGSAIPVVER